MVWPAGSGRALRFFDMVPPILMPTAPRYLPLAQWTCGRIARFWSGHPRIFLCGAEGDGRALPLRDDPRDWMRVAASACADLLADGFRQVYVILDDHPPIAECHAEHLGRALPGMVEELGMTSLVTGGYGPLNKRKGRATCWKGFTPECLPLSQPWKLPLHPALWNLQRLHDILIHLINRLPDSVHTPWAFERIGSDLEKGGVREDWLSACWRVNARETSTPEALALHDFRDRIVRLALRVSACDALVFAGRDGRDAVVGALAGLRHPRIGPYPCFWSGVMKKGRINQDYLFYARFKNRPDLVEGLVNIPL